MPARKDVSKFRVGESVSAKWPGGNVYYPATVTRITKDRKYEVKFADQTVHTIHQDHITSKSASDTKKSPSDTKKSPRTPRKASRGRPPSRSRSRNRANSKSPRTKPSPSRKANSFPFKKSPPTRSSPRLNDKKVIHTSEDDISKKTVLPTVLTKETEESMVDTDATNLSWFNFLGTAFLTIFAPVFVFWVNLSCDRYQCSARELPKFPRNLREYVDIESVLMYSGWLLFQLVLALLPFGQRVEGQPLRDGTRLTYRINGLHAFFITMAIVGGLMYNNIPLKIILDKYLQLVVTSTIFSFLISFLLLLRANKAATKMLVAPRAPPNAVYDFFMGRELNPRIGNFDLKMFFHLRPGLLGWAVLNTCMLWTEYTQSRHVLPSIWFVGVSQLIYILDAFVFEESHLSSWNITTEGLGFMLVFGNLTFVPFVFTLPVRYLLLYRPNLHPVALGGIIILNVLGYILYRGSNKLKDDFRRNPYQPKFTNCKQIVTKSTRKILVAGFWGWVRHPNYLGDLMIALSWCLPCGVDHIIPYVYFFYLLIFLSHRANRDKRLCYWKYGNAWNEYCKQVRYAIIPKIY